MGDGKVWVREFDPKKDRQEAVEIERVCDMGPATGGGGTMTKKKKKKQSSTSLFVDQMGDPISRIRNFPEHVMLVAEYGEEKEMVGVIRCGIKSITRGTSTKQALLGVGGAQSYTKVAYILGLRVSPTHRRLGIGTVLVEKVEEWCKRRGAEYSYMATDRHNSASLDLFTRKLSYTPFRSPSVLVHPVHAHRHPLPSSASILRLPPSLAAPIYRRLFPPSRSEFFPADVDSLLVNPLTLGTFLAVPSDKDVTSSGLSSLPPSFAVMSLWNTKDVYRMQVKGASAAARAAMAWARAADERMPWMRIPSVGDVFTRPFGFYFMYGLHMEGKAGPELMRALCRLAHNAATGDEGCAAVVAEVAREDPVRAAVPHWRRFSWDEDVVCMKRLKESKGCDDDDDDDWVRSRTSSEVMFVDPRDF